MVIIRALCGTKSARLSVCMKDKKFTSEVLDISIPVQGIWANLGGNLKE